MKNWIKKISLFILLNLLIVPTFVEAATLEQIQENGKIVMATSADFPPFEWLVVEDSESKVVGIDVDIAQAIADKIGVELEIVNTSFESLVTQIQTGKADMVLAGMSYTPERAKVVDFSDVYYENQSTMVVQIDQVDHFSADDAFVEAKIGVQKGTIQEQIAKDEFPDAELVSMNKNGDLIEALKAGHVDGVLMDQIVVEEFVNQNEDHIAIVEKISIELADDGYAVIVQKGNEELLEEINEVIKELIESDQLSEIIEKNANLNAESNE